MRRLPASIWLGGLVALLLLGAALASVTGGAPFRAMAEAQFHGARELAARAAAPDWLVGTAHAEDLQFKPVPRESLSRLERMRVVKRKAAEAAPPPAEAPAAPETPVVVEPPSAPEVVIGRSGSVMRIGSDIHIGPNEVVRGDLSSMGGDIEIEGHVEGDVVAMRGDVRLHSTARVDGDVVCIGGTLTEDPGAHVGGQRVTAIGGGRDRDIDIEDRPRRERSDRRGHSVSYALTWLLILLGLAWALTRFAPGSTRAAVEGARTSPGRSFFIGAAVWALVIPSLVALALIVALLCITIIGIPLALAALVGYVLFLVLVMGWGYVVGASVVGARLVRAAPALAGTAGLGEAGISLTGQAVRGVLAVSGAAVVGQLLRWIGSGTPLGGLGVMIWIVAFVASAALTTLGAGAWLHAEFTSGALGRWWAGRRTRFGGNGAPPPAGPVPPGGPPSAPAGPTAPYSPAPAQSPGYGSGTPPPPVPPSPPTAFAPPAPRQDPPEPPPQDPPPAA